MAAKKNYKQHMRKTLDLLAILILGHSVIASIGLALFGIWWLYGVGIDTWYAVISVGTPLGVAAILAFVLARNRSIRLAGALPMASSATGLLLAETYLAFSGQGMLHTNALEGSSPTLSRVGALGHRPPDIDGIRTFPAAFPKGYLTLDKLGNLTSRFRDAKGILLPLSGMPSVTTVFCNEGYGTVVYQSDRYGFRNPNHVWEEKPGPSAAAIGDS